MWEKELKEDHHPYKEEQTELCYAQPCVWTRCFTYNLVGYHSNPEKGSRYYSHFTDVMAEVQLTVGEVEIQAQVCMEPKACTYFSPTLPSL